jgi:mannose-1-phosphate guanylyltransferase
LRKKFGANEIFLQTNSVQAEIAKKQVPEIVAENIFIEPEMRNQGPATGMAAAMLFKLGFADEPFILVQADVLREPDDKFLEMMEGMDKSIRENGKLMTGGIKPEFAVMGVDYLVVNNETKKMEMWLGRGSKEEVEKFLGEGKALIHTNHYAWTPRKMLDCFKIRKPEWYEPLMNIVNGGEVVTEYAKLAKGPIEEVTQIELLDGYVWELPFKWVDFGTWESVANYIGYAEDKAISIDADNNFVRVPGNKKVALIGVENLIVIDSRDGLLICRKDQSGRVGEVVDKLGTKLI